MGMGIHIMDPSVDTAWEYNVDMARYVFKYPISPYCIWLCKDNRIGEISHIMASLKQQTYSHRYVHSIDSVSIDIGTVDNLIKTPSLFNGIVDSTFPADITTYHCT